MSQQRRPNAAATDRCGSSTGRCSTASDGTCDDGGPGSRYSGCPYGSDCEDCGYRRRSPPPPWPPGEAPPPSPPRLPRGTCGPIDQHLLVAFYFFILLGFFFTIAACAPSAARPKLSAMLCLAGIVWIGLAAFTRTSALRALFLPEQCPHEAIEVHHNDVAIALTTITMIISVVVVVGALVARRSAQNDYRKRIEAIEGDLPARLADGSLRLLRVAWLLERPADWVVLRQQDLPEEALWSPAEAERLLGEEKVAALSYKWQGPFNSSKGGGDQPDGSRFHLEKLLAFYRAGKHARQWPALLWDFAALPQHDPLTGAKRSDAETARFKAGLGVMSNAYASPRVLVLQQRRIPLELERELHDVYGGAPPAERLDLIPYAGAKCRSGWCTSESACVMLMTAGGSLCIGSNPRPAQLGDEPLSRCRVIPPSRGQWARIRVGCGQGAGAIRPAAERG